MMTKLKCNKCGERVNVEYESLLKCNECGHRHYTYFTGHESVILLPEKAGMTEEFQIYAGVYSDEA